MNSTTTTFFTVNRTNVKKIDPKRDSISISIEEFEDLIKYRKICKSIFEMFGELLDLEEVEE